MSDKILFILFLSKKFRFFKKFIENNKELIDINSVDPNKETLLHYSIKFDNFNILKFLLNCEDIDLCSQNKLGNTALHLAIIYKYYDLAVYLINHGAPLDIKNKKGYDPLHLIILSKNKQLFEYVLIERRTYPYLRDKKGNTICHLAVKFGAVRILKIILNETDLIDYKNDLGETALHLAIRRGSLKMIKIILEHNPNIEIIDSNGISPKDILDSMFGVYETFTSFKIT